jgi:hypothetical protein
MCCGIVNLVASGKIETSGGNITRTLTNSNPGIVIELDIFKPQVDTKDLEKKTRKK